MLEDDDAPKRRSTLGFAMISAAGLTLLCVAIGQGASEFANLTSPQRDLIADAAGKGKSPAFNAIDLSTTGSIKGQPILISPCNR
jgi:hypothetical protein